MKFIKLQHHNEIKKILLKKEDLSYEELYNMILHSFFKSDYSKKLIIKYKDLENQEIVINNNQELGLALNLFYLQKFIKFIVYSSRILEKTEAEKEKTENIDLPEEKNVDVLSIDIIELQSILSAAFDESNLTTRLENHLFSLIEKKGINPSNISKYELKTDFNFLSSYFQQFLQMKMDTAFSKIKLKLDQKEDPPQLKNELSIINNSDIINHISFSEANFSKDVHLLKKEENEENKENAENSRAQLSETIPMFKINLDNDQSILESIYELVDREEIDSLPEISPLTKSKSDNYENRRADILSVTMQNNGKMKFTSKVKKMNEEVHPYNKNLFDVPEISFNKWSESKK